MNIYELEKKATPGSIHVDDGYISNDDGAMVAQGPDANGFDLALLVHSRNHFMEALEALKECISGEGSMAFTSESVEAAHRRLNAINITALQALAKLETVEGM